MTLRESDPSWGSATSSGTISKTSQSLQPLCLNSPGKIQNTNLDLYLTEAYLPNQDYPGGLCANLAQRNDQGQIQIISHASRQLRENEKSYKRFLLKTAAATWGMDNFNEYLNGSRFTL